MRWVDVAIVLVLVGSGVLGLIQGLIVEVGGIVGAIAGLVVAREEYRTARSFLGLFFHRDAHLSMAAFIVVFLIVWLLVLILAQMLRTVLRFTPLGALDRLGGAILGLALGVLTVEVLLLLATGSHDASLRHSIHASHLAAAFQHAVPGLRSLIPNRLPGAPR